ncbi:hypothetical protein [Planosporangium mesophilum]|uniref:Uncharacterized protein n=1 Tax=Planosporangium mesophilum TaxID=689768 RepID=A0A8J3TAY3_9ACTN|nr:hypothetical protein [Planosporangium mesophilum]NJC85288.1 hypothetical protein [Planosporangium mesophilum]GII23258.1 hypothetical protein Pme01_28550 [Planosporangium mesophilum]
MPDVAVNKGEHHAFGGMYGYVPSTFILLHPRFWLPNVQINAIPKLIEP